MRPYSRRQYRCHNLYCQSLKMYISKRPIA
nr:MAG TPA: hypothetical protein [Caudoviricetes sp.]